MWPVRPPPPPAMKPLPLIAMKSQFRSCDDFVGKLLRAASFMAGARDNEVKRIAERIRAS